MAIMTSKTVHMYAHRQLKVGERFEAEDRHVPVLTALGRAEVAKGKKGQQSSPQWASD